MNNFVLLVCHFDKETKIQEFSVPLEIEKIEKWSDLIDISLQKIKIDNPRELFEQKSFQIESEQTQFMKVEYGSAYLVTGGTNDQKKLEILKKLTDLSEIEASTLLEAFHTVEVCFIIFIFSHLM